MKTALIALLFALTLPAMGQDVPASTATTAQPSFWKRLGGAVKDTGHRIGQEIQSPGSSKGDAFRPLTPGASELVGMFTPETSGTDGTGKILWPRVALPSPTSARVDGAHHTHAKV